MFVGNVFECKANPVSFSIFLDTKIWLVILSRGQGASCVAVWYLTPFWGYFILPHVG